MRWCVSFCFLAVLTITSALSDTEEWLNFKKYHGKVYKSTIEEKARYSVFQANLRKIEEHNEKFEKGLTTYTLGMNKFGDLTAEEFADLLQPLPKMDRPTPSLKIENVQYNGHIPGRKDWREKGAVTEVKNQGGCEGTWAFGATAAIESAHFIKSGKLVTMSEQNLLDCVTECKGCKSGSTDKAMEYVREHGITTEGNYPYNGKDEECQLNGTEPVIKIKNYVFVKVNDEEDLRQAVARQPVAVTLDARGFHLYKSGIWDNLCLEDLSLDNSLLVVGYDLDHNLDIDYWILKNSWGKSWGMDGYMKFRRNMNRCGIASYALYPVV